MSDLVSGRLESTPAGVEQPLPAVETGRPVANRETPRETSAAELRAELDAIHNALGTIAAANASPFVSDDERRHMIREATDRAAAALREVERSV